jgi:hypothetical protein
MIQSELRIIQRYKKFINLPKMSLHYLVQGYRDWYNLYN